MIWGDGWSYATLHHASSGYTARVDRGITSVERATELLTYRCTFKKSNLGTIWSTKYGNIPFTAFVPYI